MTRLIALATGAVLVAFAGGYGWHRDEFYYLRAGLHPALGYVDQPPLTPLIAGAGYQLFGDWLVGFRLPAALAAALTVLLTGALAGQLGAGRGGRALAAGAVAVSAFPIATGHVVSTSTFDLLAWTALSLLLVRAVRDGGPVWLAAGAVAGLGLQNKALIIALPAAVALGLLAVGPRSALRGRWPWLGAGVALLIWAPHLAWQAANGWPQLTMADSIATVGNGGSVGRWLFLPFQLVLFSPLLVPIWLAGWRALHREPALRSFAVAFPLLAVLLLAAGGKPYYLAGMYPLLLAAGAQPTLRWVARAAGPRAARLRRGLLAGALAFSAAITAVLMLPVLPARLLPGTPIVAIQPISAESIGWPEFTAAVSAAYRAIPPPEQAETVALTRNYGQAGAIDLFRDRDPSALPPAYSGHNAYYSWGPPPESARTVVAVGVDETRLREWFGSVRPAGRVDNGIGLDNEEQGRPIWLCRDRRVPWAVIWPALRRVG
ncbi:hypothetical protein BKA01_006297 [Pseudonocardia eucalypti]|nr:hypothetical protein [Pseudonocardia eucalypti]